jgi:hypothetical protein
MSRPIFYGAKTHVALGEEHVNSVKNALEKSERLVGQHPAVWENMALMVVKYGEK